MRSRRRVRDIGPLPCSSTRSFFITWTCSASAFSSTPNSKKMFSTWQPIFPAPSANSAIPSTLSFPKWPEIRWRGCKHTSKISGLNVRFFKWIVLSENRSGPIDIWTFPASIKSSSKIAFINLLTILFIILPSFSFLQSTLLLRSSINSAWTGPVALERISILRPNQLQVLMIDVEIAASVAVDAKFCYAWLPGKKRPFSQIVILCATVGRSH